MGLPSSGMADPKRMPFSVNNAMGSVLQNLGGVADFVSSARIPPVSWKQTKLTKPLSSGSMASGMQQTGLAN